MSARRRSKRSGFTLIEAAIVLALTAALLALLAMYFVRGQRYAADTETYATVQRQSSIVLRKLTSDLATGAYQHLDTSPDGDAVWFLSSGPTAEGQPYVEFREENGKIFWKKWVCYYFDAASGTVMRAEQPLASPDSELLAPPSPAADVETFRTSPAVARQPVGRQISRFRASRTTRGVQIRLATMAEAPLTNSTADQRETEVEVSSEIMLIN